MYILLYLLNLQVLFFVIELFMSDIKSIFSPCFEQKESFIHYYIKK